MPGGRCRCRGQCGPGPTARPRPFPDHGQERGCGEWREEARVRATPIPIGPALGSCPISGGCGGGTSSPHVPVGGSSSLAGRQMSLGGSSALRLAAESGAWLATIGQGTQRGVAQAEPSVSFFLLSPIGRNGCRLEFPIGRRTLLLGRRGGVGGAPLADESALRLNQRGRPEPSARRPRPPRPSGLPARPEEPPSAAPFPLPAAPWPRDPSKCGPRCLAAA